MASFQPVPNGVRVQCDVRGRRASKTLPNMRAAREWAREKEAELAAKVDGDLGKGKTLRDALRRFAEEVSPKRRGERWEIVRLAAFEGKDHSLPIGKGITHVADDDIRAWRDRRQKVCGDGTVLRDMTLLSAVFEHARTEWKWVRHNPILDVKKPAKPAHRERVITGPEIRNMLRALGYERRGAVRTVSQSVAVCFLLALATGMRAKELCSLRWDDVHEEYGTARNVKSIRRGVNRDVPFSPVARRLVARMEGWDAETVFGVTPSTLDALFRRAKKRAGYADAFVFHDSRHTAATRMARKVDVLTLCKIFGWKRTDQALTYFNPSAAQIAARL